MPQAAPEAIASSRRRRRYSRLLLKISGEAFCRPDGQGLDMDEVFTIARQIKSVRDKGIELAVVVGGGNFLRGASLAQRGVERATADYVGMLATVMNGLVLQDAQVIEQPVPGARLSRREVRWDAAPDLVAESAGRDRELDRQLAHAFLVPLHSLGR